MDRVAAHALKLGAVVLHLTEKVEDATERFGTYGHRDALARVDRLHAAAHTVGRGHSAATHDVVTHLGCYLANDFFALVHDLDGVEKIGDSSFFKLNIEDRTDDTDHLSHILAHKYSFLRAAALTALPLRKQFQ